MLAPEERSSAELELALLEGRYCEIRMLFYVGKDPTFALAASVPFLMNPRQQHGWYYHGGGLEMTPA